MEPLTVPGTLDALSLIANYIKLVSSEAGLDKKAAYNLRLAVDEIATNIVTYGYEEAGLEGEITISSELNDQVLIITLDDTGIAYDPYQAIVQEEATIDEPLEDRPIGGLGIYLTIQGVDQFIYERQDSRNLNRFIVKRSSSAPSD